ncbi:winged helix-turn-helix transcriptional regulator [Candidatus Woesearchaeota archaeon]|nr:winged helix-turn-helix transcriptional regulator [Candidatus Woesearchaeota archaeon]
MKESETLELKKSTSELKEALKAISDHIEPKVFPKIREIILNRKKCIYVEFSGNNIPYYAFGRAYIRVGDEDKKISSQELEKLILQKNKERLRWDSAICEKANLDDIDDNSLKKFVEFSRQSKRLSIEHDDKEMVLRKLKLMSGSKITNAGILLFGKHPTDFLDNSLVRCGRFKGVVKEEFIDMKDMDGNLFQNLERAIAFLQDHLQLQATIKGLRREEKWEIPLEALREATINAFIHRDYYDQSFVYIKLSTTLEKKVLQKIQKTPKMTRKELAVQLAISEETVKEYLDRLRKKGLLIRRGGRKEGYWEIITEKKSR